MTRLPPEQRTSRNQEIVRELERGNVSQAKLARKYNVHESLVSKLKRGVRPIAAKGR